MNFVEKIEGYNLVYKFVGIGRFLNELSLNKLDFNFFISGY